MTDLNPTKEEIRACPFCGKIPNGIEKYTPVTGESKNPWWVTCSSLACYVCGPHRKTKLAAIRAWNGEKGV